MELNLVNYIRIDLVSPLDPPIVFKDKNPIYGYRFADGLMWIYDAVHEGTLICGITLSNIKAVWFNGEPCLNVSKTLPKNGKCLESNLSLEGRVNDNMVLQEMLKNEE